MEIGKVPNNYLKNILLSKINYKRPEVLLRPEVGEDCSAIDFQNDICVLTSDPITGTVEEIGRLAVLINCNDIASSGAEPLGLLATILAPPQTTEDELAYVMQQLCDTADTLNVDILGGHTEITGAVNRIVIMSTAVGKVHKEKLVSTSGAKTGDLIIITKTAGIEGTSIIAKNKSDDLEKEFGKEMVDRAIDFINLISVVKEGRIAADFGVSSMHDITEGGVMGALWEVAEASGVGVEVYKENIPVAKETRDICKMYGIDPLKLISSGSMIITCEDGEGLLKIFEEKGIAASIIGRVTGRNEKIMWSEGKPVYIEAPDSDELYKVLK